MNDLLTMLPEPPHSSSRPQRTQSLSATLPRVTIPHIRASSIATSSPAARKRLSQSFPVLPAGYAPPRQPHSTAAPLRSSSPHPEDPSAFLTALAAQERRVLELKEELGKAETELRKLKRQWATHEANKSRYELAVNSGSAGGGEAMASPTGRAEFQRRQKLAVGGGGKVLPSQRHQRTLSLLSPVRVQDSRVPFPRPKDLEEEEAGQVAPPMVRRAPRTTPPPPPLPIERPKNQDVLLKTGQQIAADFRDGLWTFLEDLKQATVGDEVAVPQPAAGLRRASSSRTSRERPGVRRGKRVPDVEEALIDFADEEVSSFRWSSSSAYSDYPELGGTAPASRSSTPRTSTSSITSQHLPDLAGGNQWAASLASPTIQLKKHATALMSQVEKSFTIPPSPEDDDTAVVNNRATLSRSNSTGCQMFPGSVGASRSRRTALKVDRKEA